MKKVLFSILITLLCFCFYSYYPVFSDENVQLNTNIKEKKHVEKLSAKASGVVVSNVSLNVKQIARFYPEDSVFFSYIDITPDTLNKIKDLIGESAQGKVEVTDLKKPSSLPEFFQIFQNLTVLFGPDASLGVLMPEEAVEEPPMLFVIKIKPEKFSAAAVMEFLGPKYKFIKESYKGVDLNIAEKPKEQVVFASYNNYLLIANYAGSVKKAIDNFSADRNMLSDEDAVKAVSYLPQDSMFIGLFNNISSVKIGLMLDKKKEEMKKHIEEDIPLQPEEESFLNNDIRLVSFNHLGRGDKKDAIKTILPEKDVAIEYANKFIGTKSYTALYVNTSKKNIEFGCYTPYDITFLKELNPELAKALLDLFAPAEPFGVSKSLPDNAVGYLMLANLGSIGRIVNSIDNPDLQKSVSSVKLVLAGLTGLDLETDILSMFDGQTTIAVVPDDKEPSPLLLLTYKEDTELTLNKLLNVAQKMQPELVIKEKKFKSVPFNFINTDQLPFEVAFGNIHDSMVFGNSRVVKNIAKKANKPSSFLFDSKGFLFYKDLDMKPSNIIVFVDFNKVKNSFENNYMKDLPDELSEALNSLYLSVSNKKDNVFAVNLFIDLNR